MCTNSWDCAKRRSDLQVEQRYQYTYSLIFLIHKDLKSKRSSRATLQLFICMYCKLTHSVLNFFPQLWLHAMIVCKFLPNFESFPQSNSEKKKTLDVDPNASTTNLPSSFLTHEARTHRESVAIFIQTKSLHVAMSGYSLRLSGTFNFLDLHFSPLTVASTRKSVIIALKFLNFGLTTAKRTSYKLARQLSFVKARLHRRVSCLLFGKNT